MSNGGYSSAKQQSEAIAAALRDIATLIGEVGPEEVTLESGERLKPGLGLASDAADLARRARDIQQGIFKVLVLGEFKNGKSTLLNATLGSKVLPAKVTPATAIITVLVYGEGKEVAIYGNANGGSNPRMVSWEAFGEEFKLTKSDIESLDKTGYLDRFQAIDYAQLECQHPFCANGVRLIDSPGLGEQASRTRVTTNFLKQSHAVIFVLNATRILSEDEKKFIETRLGKGRMNQVFFVVNRVNQIESNDLPDVKNWVQSVLKPHFLDENGQFDEAYYGRRVFFVNALGALEARIAEPTDEDKLEESGVPALERELEQFLTSKDKVTATFETTVHFLSNVVDEAHKRITQQKASLDAPLAELEKRQHEAEKKLTVLEGKKDDIERTILLFRDVIKQRLYSSLRDFINSMQETWGQDAQNHIKLDEVMSILDVLQSMVSKDVENKIAAALEVQVKRYLQAKLGEWSEGMPGIIGDDVARMMAEIEVQVEDFQMKLDEIGNMFAGGMPEEFVTDPKKTGNRLMQMVLGFGNFDPAAETSFDNADWTGLFTRLLQQVLTVIVIFGLFGGPIAWVFLLVFESWYIFLHREKFKQRILEKLGERLHAELQKELPSKQSEIYALVESKFTQFAQHVTRTLQSQIDEKRAEIGRIVRQKQDASFSVEQEKTRLETISRRLAELSETVNGAAKGTSDALTGAMG